MIIEINIKETLDYMLNEMMAIKKGENRLAYLEAVNNLLYSILNNN